MATKRTVSADDQQSLFQTLQQRFDQNMHRHRGLKWSVICAKLEKNPDKIWSLLEMEKTGGEPDVIGFDQSADAFVFYDCAEESPKGRRSVCFDREGLKSRKEHAPSNTAMDMALAMGIELLTEQEYRALQKFGTFDAKTSSWIKTPDSIRELGGALFADFRYGTVFVYHNGAQSYYAARGFRGCLNV